MSLLAWLLGEPPAESEPQRDPLRDIIDAARRSNAEAIEAVNESRVQRGESPIAPSWEDLIGPRRDGGG